MPNLEPRGPEQVRHKLPGVFLRVNMCVCLAPDFAKSLSPLHANGSCQLVQPPDRIIFRLGAPF